ncbi:MAG: metallopeptidase family protein [Ignavibacteriales bacterium]|nr:metallopeptidase family protein [Ignavibacteriales bacterium]
MTREEFEKIAEEAFESLPPTFKDRVDNVQIVIEDYPTEDLWRGVKAGKHSLLGLYQGIPLPQRNTWYGTSPTVPDTIYLFQKNIEAQSRNQEELRRRIMEVLFHELGHYFGMNEREVRSALRNFV